MENKEFKYDVIVIGGLGHVGLPLGIVFATKDLNVCLLDLDKEKAETVAQGKMPYIENGAEPLLKEVLAKGNLTITLDQSVISEAKVVIITIGTPVDEYLNPETKGFFKFIKEIKQYLDPSQLLVIRSTVYPGTCDQILNQLVYSEESGLLAYCPERISEGYAIEELGELPQVVAGVNQQSVDRAAALFDKISPQIVYTTIKEAELIKLFSNAWRYIQFAITNQFFMICEYFDVDYDRVRFAMTEGYKRTSGLPSAGFAAGPCLLKDTMMLSAFYGNNFLLGHSAMMINEGLPNFIVDKLAKNHQLKNKTIGILGMAFKAEVDDIRDSLSYKLRKVLEFKCSEVLCSDEYVKSANFVSKEELVKSADIVIIGVPHAEYRKIEFPDNVDVLDIWGFLK